MSPLLTQAAQILSISVSLSTAGGIAALSIFDIPEIQSQPADRSLPMLRWLFSRGSHIAPQGAMISSAGFAYLAFNAIPKDLRSISQLLATSNGFKVNGYLAAALLGIAIGPFTQFVMVPNNFALIKKNEELGGARSAKAAQALKDSGYGPSQRSAIDSVNGKGEGDEFTDTSGPQTKTTLSSSDANDQEVYEMMSKFARQNLWRAVLLGGSGVVGLMAALA